MTRNEVRQAIDDLYHQIKHLRRELKTAEFDPENQSRRIPSLDEWNQKGNKWTTTVNHYKLVIYRHEDHFRWYIYNQREGVRIADSRKRYESRSAARGRIGTYFKYNVAPQ